MPPINPITGMGGQTRKPQSLDNALALLPMLTGGGPEPIQTSVGFLFGPEERALQHKIQTDAADYNRRQSEALIGLAAMAEEGRRRREQAAAARGFAATLPGANEAQTAYLASDPAALRTRSEQIGSSVAPPSQYQLGQLGFGERRAAATERQADIAARNAASLDRYRGLRADLAILQEQRQAETDTARRRKLDLETRKIQKEMELIDGDSGLFPGKDGFERAANEVLRSHPPEDRPALKVALSEQRLTKPSFTTLPDPVTGAPSAAAITQVDIDSAVKRAATIRAATASGEAASAPTGGPSNVTFLGERITDATRRARALATSSLTALDQLDGMLGARAYPALEVLIKRLPLEDGRRLTALIEQAAASVTQDLYARNVTGPEFERRAAAMIPQPGDTAGVVKSKLAFLRHATEGLAGPKRDADGGAGADIPPDIAAKIKAKAESYIRDQGMSPEAAYEAAKAGTGY